MPQIYITGSAGTFDVTELITSISWAGDYRQCARTLDFAIVSSPYDSSIPEVNSSVGSAVLMEEDGASLFVGYIVSRTKSTSGNTIDISCFDRGFYLKKIEVSRKFINVTPEDALGELCKAFEIKTGKIAKTGIRLSRNFPGCSLWELMSTMYSLAGEQTKKKYHIGFIGDKLCVRIKEPSSETVIIEGGSNLIDATTTESIEGMVNSVAIYDETGKLLQTVKSDENIKLYGFMQKVLSQTKESVTTKAQQLLNDGGVEQKITLNCLGDIRCTAGGCVIVQEPYTGLYGLFYIDSDTHQWKNGVYVNKLVLNFKAMTDKKTAGEAVK
ncbi:MAG: hypothetical protein RR639_04345 [Hydrogenoanaerobacterium sp.]